MSCSSGNTNTEREDTFGKDTELVNEIDGLMDNRCLWQTAIDTRTLQPP